LAKPEKNVLPVSKSLMEISSSKLAPAQNVLLPADLSMITLIASLFPASFFFV